jgi:hypothetical protein
MPQNRRLGLVSLYAARLQKLRLFPLRIGKTPPFTPNELGGSWKTYGAINGLSAGGVAA